MQIFQYFIKEFRDKIDMPELEIRDLAMGIRGYGIFANVSFFFASVVDMHVLLAGVQVVRH